MKFLHLEDNPDDAELVRTLLKREWPDCEITVATDRDEFVAALREPSYDLVLSDFSLGQFDGLEALHLTRTERPQLPFVFFSGNIGEDRAIEAVRAGAQDYVLKDRMKRLVTALHRALEDAAERRRLQAAEEDRQRLAAILEATPDFVGLTSPDGEFRYLNRAARRLLGVADGPVPAGLHLDAVLPPDHDGPPLSRHLPAAIRDGTWSGETVLRTHDGRRLPVSLVLLAHRSSDGTVSHISAAMRDLSAQKRTEALLEGQKQILEMIAGGLPLGQILASLLEFLEGQSPDIFCSILLLDESGRHLRLHATPRLPAAYARAIDGAEIGPAAGSCGTAAHRRAAVYVSDIATDPLWDYYRQFALPHGIRACWSTPFFDRDDRLLGVFSIQHPQPGPPGDFHLQLIEAARHLAAICVSRHQAEQRLHDQADLLNQARDAIIVFDPTHRISFWNTGAERIFGWTAAEALGRTDEDLLGDDPYVDLDPVRDAIRSQEEWEGEVPLHDRQKRPIVLQCRFTVIRDELGQSQGRLVIASDITEKRRIEQQFLRAQRLESIGMLAAGIAHDLNNVLAPILLAAPMLRDHIADPDDLPIIETLEKSGERGAALVRQILSFAHGTDGGHQLIQPKHLMRDLAGFVTQTFPKTIRIVEHVPSDLWTVRGNPTQLHQVVLNLCVNARDAMPRGGTLTLTAENRLLDAEAAAAIPGARPGACVVLQVEDDGSGIPPEVLGHIWEPFFTTKGTGKGTGLGLSTVRGIVERHAGFLTVRTAPGQGTTFSVYLHAAEYCPEPPPGGPAVPLPPRGAGELILVVDDEPSVRNLAATILAQHGYRILTAGDGSEAVALFAPRATEIQVVVTDLAMPNLDGAGLARVLRRLNATTRILFTSGLGEGRSEHPFSDLSAPLLRKPFKPESLLAAVSELLHPTQPGETRTPA